MCDSQKIRDIQVRKAGLVRTSVHIRI